MNAHPAKPTVLMSTPAVFVLFFVVCVLGDRSDINTTSVPIRFEGLHSGVTRLWVYGDTIYYISFETTCGSEESRLLNVSSSV